MNLDLDDTDRAILRALQQDATLKASELGQRVGLSQPVRVAAGVRRLTEAGCDSASGGSTSTSRHWASG